MIVDSGEEQLVDLNTNGVLNVVLLLGGPNIVCLCFQREKSCDSQHGLIVLCADEGCAPHIPPLLLPGLPPAPALAG